MSSLEEIKANKNYHTAGIILALLLLWMASGLIASKNNNTHNSDSEAPPKGQYSVRAKNISAQDYAARLRISAKTEANRSVNLRAEVSGQISRLPIEKGRIVKTGDVICELAIEDRQLRVEQTKAEVNKAKLEHDAALRLKSSGFQARTVIAAKKSELETARANLKRREIDLEKTKIRAPFDGVVDARPVEIGDLMQRGDICATVLDFDPLLVVGQVAGTNISRIKTGDQVYAQLLTGEQVEGNVRFISSSSDNLTRTFRMEVAVPNQKNLLHSGITADILFSGGQIQAHLISPSLLSLDDSGKIGVRILNQQSQVRFVNVELVGDDSQGVWVTGLPAQATLITVGQEYVSDGQTVTVSLEPSSQQESIEPPSQATATISSAQANAQEPTSPVK